jgi:hypothetical protein
MPSYFAILNAIRYVLILQYIFFKRIIFKNMNDIICPNCGKKIQIDEAVRRQLEGTILKEEREKQKLELEKTKTELSKEIERKLREESQKELKKAESEKKLLEEKLLKEQKNREEFEKIAAQKAARDASQKAEAEYRLKLKEKDKQLEDARNAAAKANDELKRKLNQGSQQLQGDVLEKDIEERLRETFPNDIFKPVPTGVRGGDIIQEVRNSHGNSAGFILWEAKRTKAWQKDWLSKLKEDMRNINASDCILVSDVLPTNVKIYDRIENAWVTSYEYAIKLAYVLRIGLLNIAIAKSSASHTDEQLKELYDVITSDSFRQMFEARDEVILALKQELDADKRSAEKRWKRQSLYIEKLARNNSQLYGELEAHIPSLKPLKEPGNIAIESETGGDEDIQKTLI